MYASVMVARTDRVRTEARSAHNKDDTELLDESVLEGMLVALVGRVCCGGLVVAGSGIGPLLLDKDI